MFREWYGCLKGVALTDGSVGPPVGLVHVDG